MASSSKMRVVLLASEWGSKRGGLSTFNRELAIELAKHPDLQVSMFLPRCDQEEKNAAQSHNITLVQATRRPGYGENEWLSSPPKDLQMDLIIGHGVVLGRQAQIISENRECKWIQFVHTDPEELGMFKDYPNAISRGAQKHQDEVELCVLADFIVAVGSKLAEAYRSYLRFCEKDQKVFVLTPGIFSEFLSVPQSKQDGRKCRVLAFGRGDAEDFSLKGFDIAAKAVARLDDAQLIFVGAKQQDEVASRLKECNIPPNRLRVRTFIELRERLKKQFSEVDLAIMPSRTEGFGLVALEAMSAGLPVLVSANSGFGEAMREVDFAETCVINSEDPEVWSAEIKKLWTKKRERRLRQAKVIRDNYAARYNWTGQCNDLVETMRSILNGNVFFLFGVILLVVNSKTSKNKNRVFLTILSNKLTILSN